MTTTTIKNNTGYCSDILENSRCMQLPFHNVIHTQEVIDNVFLIADASRLSPKEANFIAIAAYPIKSKLIC